MRNLIIKFGPMVNTSSSEETTSTPACYTATAEIVSTPEAREYNYSRDCAGSGNFIDRAATKSSIRKDVRSDLKLIKNEKKNMDQIAKLDYKRTLIENQMWYNQEKSSIKQAERIAVDEICSLSYWRNR